jgi:crotonobetainyl-CoA:carnitine CoA-transferase CaiB-like acyl-CoA transferase
VRAAAPLDGLRVLDLSAELRGAWCGRLLAEQGADVLLVEPPGGNRWRQVGPFAGGEAGPERSLPFLHYYAGRRSVVADGATAEGRALLRALARRADVVLVDRRDGLALADAVAAANPRVIVAAITCHGSTGPDRGLEGGDLIAVAAGGLAALTGDPARAPLRPGGDQGEHAAGLHAAVAVVGAVLARDLGVAPAVSLDVSAQECVASVLENAMEFALLEGRAVTRQHGRHPISWPGRVFPCRDGHVVISCGSAEQARACFTLVGDTEMAGHPVLEDRDGRRAAAPWLEERLIAGLAAHGREDLFHRGQALGIPIGLVHDAASLLEDPQLRASAFFREVDHPAAGRFVDVGGPFRLDGAAGHCRPAPLLGEHIAEVLAEIGGPQPAGVAGP